MYRVRKQIGLNKLDEAFNGNGVTIAVLDTGVCIHPDLKGRVIEFRDFISKQRYPYDDNGHGTHVCGIIAGNGVLSNGLYKGIAPGASLLVGKILDQNGDGKAEDLLCALDWVLEKKEQYNIRILNLSVGFGMQSEKWKESELKSKINKIWESGILIICAAGNTGPDDGSISEIGNNEKVLSVGCHDGDYYKNYPNRCEVHSARGKEHSLKKPNLVAPGTNILSCNNLYRKKKNHYVDAYVAKSGTSMSTSVVSGIAALYFQKNPQNTNEQCKSFLEYSAKDLGLSWNQQGWGIISVNRFEVF